MQPRRTGTLHAAGRAAMWPTLAMLLAPLLVLGWAGLVHPARAQVGAPVLVSRDGAGSAGDAQSYEARIDARGRRIAFSSAAANLVPGDGNGVADVFLLDRDGPGLRRISLRSDGRESSGPSGMPALSADGRWLAFVAESALGTEPAPWGGLYLKALDTGALTLLAADTDEGRGRTSRRSSTASVTGWRSSRRSIWMHPGWRAAAFQLSSSGSAVGRAFGASVRRMRMPAPATWPWRRTAVG